MYREVLVPLDGFPAAEESLPQAAEIAFAMGARVHVVNVVDRRTYPPYAHSVGPVEWWHGKGREAAHAYVTECCGPLREVGIDTVASVLSGAAPSALLQYIDEHRIDLIVMTTHRHRSVSRLWAGSMADHLTSAAACPILLRTHQARAGPQRHSAMRHFAHILVPLDGSELAEQAIQHARVMSRLERGRITLLCIADPAAPDIYTAGRLAAYLKEKALTFEDGFRPAFDVHVCAGPAAASITQYAQSNDVDLIVMTTHGESGVVDRVLGSTTARIVRTAHMPVLVVPAQPNSRNALSDAGDSYHVANSR